MSDISRTYLDDSIFLTNENKYTNKTKTSKHILFQEAVKCLREKELILNNRKKKLEMPEVKGKTQLFLPKYP